jgi:hypothetical protein
MLGRLDEASAMVERERSAACALDDDDEGWANESAAASEERRLWAKLGGGL